MESDSLIVVAVLYCGEWRWYRSEKDYWVLDQEKWANAFRAVGYAVPDTGASERFGIPVVDARSAADFLRVMEPMRVSADELQGRLSQAARGARDWWDVAEWFPVLLVDFDARTLWSLHTESPRFEEYMPDGWRGEWGDFLGRIPEVERYWVVEGKDILASFSK